MITGLPPYKPPVVEGVRWYCGRSYLVFVGTFDFEASAAERIACDLGAWFVDARLEPFVTCGCEQELDFSPEGSVMVM